MINVLHIADHLEEKISGVYRHIQLIQLNTDKQKFDHFLVYRKGEKIAKSFLSGSNQVLEMPSLDSKIPILAIWQVYKFAKKHEIDIFHAHFTKSYIIAGFANIILKKKLIYNFHGLTIINDFYSRGEKILIRFIHKIFVRKNIINLMLSCSKAGAKQLSAESPNFKNISCYYNGGEIRDPISGKQTDEFNYKYNIKKDNFNVIFVGRLVAQKNVSFLLEVMNLLLFENQNIILHIYGEGELMDGLKKYSKILNIDENVLFHGYVENIEQYFACFDVLFLSSIYEGLPFVVWEAMSNGLPVVAPGIAGIEEIINEARSGVIYKYGSKNDAKNKIMELLRNSSLLEKYSLNGQSCIRDKYNYQNFGKLITDSYLNL